MPPPFEFKISHAKKCQKQQLMWDRIPDARIFSLVGNHLEIHRGWSSIVGSSSCAHQSLGKMSVSVSPDNTTLAYNFA